MKNLKGLSVARHTGLILAMAAAGCLLAVAVAGCAGGKKSAGGADESSAATADVNAPVKPEFRYKVAAATTDFFHISPQQGRRPGRKAQEGHSRHAGQALRRLRRNQDPRRHDGLRRAGRNHAAQPAGSFRGRRGPAGQAGPAGLAGADHQRPRRRLFDPARGDPRNRAAGARRQPDGQAHAEPDVPVLSEGKSRKTECKSLRPDFRVCSLF